ncbi:uncharacterized protein LOC106416574 [Brassica napus]|uniref:uncharacterized protein LOC106416574 n=1 Tax=Brassica napus TaxID=3708 RepID=UPI00207ACE74|nr:uncharacterized protein LOC106416574 [Brassica napus]
MEVTSYFRTLLYWLKFILGFYRSPEPSGTIPNEFKSSSIKSSSQKKLTRKDLRLHKLVFEDDILPDGTKVGYFVAGKKMLVGYKKGFGIHCSCCNKVVSPSAFEAHAGCASRRKPNTRD